MTILNLPGQPPEHSCRVAIGGNLGCWISGRDSSLIFDVLGRIAEEYDPTFDRPIDLDKLDHLREIARQVRNTANFSQAPTNMRPDPLKWNDDFPPYVGWWNASVFTDEAAMWRWYDGKCWSHSASNRWNSEMAATATNKKANDLCYIYWRWYYPENARVKRIDSRTGQVCRVTHPEG